MRAKFNDLPRILGSILVVVVLLLRAGAAEAQVISPMQPGHYVPGIINVRDAVTPPPGLFVIWYNWGISSDTYVDRNGNELKTLNLSQLDPDLPDLDVDLEIKGFVSVPVFAYVSQFKILGGARYIAAIVPNYFTADVTAVAGLAGSEPGPGNTQVVEGSLSGFSDLVIAPLGLSWALGEFDDLTATDEELAAVGMPPRRRFNITAAYSFAAPTGRYERGADDNLGLGFWTHQFQGFGYYYPFEHQATAFMAGLTYELNGSIKDADVKPGNRLSLELGLSQYLTPWFEFSVHSAHNWQISDDTGSEVLWDPSYHDNKNSLMFGAGFWPWAGRMQVTARYGFDYGMRQRFDNTNWLLNVVFLTNLLDGK